MAPFVLEPQIRASALACEEVIIVGAGGGTGELIALARHSRSLCGEPDWKLVGILDDDPRLQGTSVYGLPVLVRPPKPHVKHVYHLFVIRVNNRDDIAASLNKNGVSTGIHYPIPLHLTGAYADLSYRKGDFPTAEAAANELLSLPMYPQLTDQHIATACKLLKDYILCT